MTIQAQDTYEPLTSSDDPSFEEFYAIYSESMPLSERKPRAQISAMATRPDYRIPLLKRDGAVLGFSIIFIPLRESFSLLEYMAIHLAHRNAGLGRELFQRSVQDAISERGNIPMLVEIDSDREPSPDQAVRRRRKQFYKRLGCLQIAGLSYILPLHGQAQPPEMDMMVYLPDNSSPIRKAQLEHWLRVIYQRVYNRSPDDSRVTRMLETVNDPVMLV